MASDYTAYPTNSDLTNRLYAAGLVVPGETEEWYGYLDQSGALLAGIRSFESAIGRRILPQTKTIVFDPPQNPNGILWLVEDLLGDPAPTITLTIAPSNRTLVANTDYWLEPYDNGRDEHPFSMVRLATLWPYPVTYATRKAIAINGNWGFSSKVPAQCFEAMICKALSILYPYLALAISKGLLGWHSNDRAEEYARYKDQGPIQTEKNQWDAFFTEAVSGFPRRVTVGL